MAKYGKKAQKKVKKAMHERKEGTLKSGKSGKKVTSKKQAIAIGLSEARKEGGKVPKKKSSKKKSSSKKRWRRQRVGMIHSWSGDVGGGTERKSKWRKQRKRQSQRRKMCKFVQVQYSSMAI